MSVDDGFTAKDKARGSLGYAAAKLQQLMGWGAEALYGLEQHSDQLADLARALLRNHATPTQVQRLISLLDRRLVESNPEGNALEISSHEVLRLVFEGVAGKSYADYPWRDATAAGALPFDNGLDPIQLAARLQRWGLHHGWDRGSNIVTASSPGGLQGVAVSRVKKFNYPLVGAWPGDYEKGLDGISGERTSFSLGVAMLMLAPQMVDYGETLVFSGTTVSRELSDSGPGYQWFPGLARMATQEGQLNLVKVRLDYTYTVVDNHCYSVRLARP